MLRRDADAGIPDLDPRHATPAAAAEHDLALGRVADGVGQEVLENAAQQARIGADDGRRAYDLELEAMLLCDQGIFPLQLRQQAVQRNWINLRFHEPGIEG